MGKIKRALKRFDRSILRGFHRFFRMLYKVKPLRPVLRPTYRFVYYHHRISAALLILLVIAGTGIPILQGYYHNNKYELSSQAQALLGKANPNLTKKLTYDAKEQLYQFNKEEKKTETPSGGNPLGQLTTQVGGGGKADKQLYSVDAHKDLRKGVTYYDNQMKLNFTLVPQFAAMEGEKTEGHLVYPLLGGSNGQLVYTTDSSGLKENLILYQSPGKQLQMKYRLELPDSLEAKLLPDTGEIGIYSADPVLFGEISYGSSDDQARVEEARKNGDKTFLTFKIPAPQVKILQDGQPTPATVHSNFSLSGNELTVTTTGLDKATYPLSIDPTVTITSNTEFQTGNIEDNNLNVSNNNLTRGSLTGGSAGTWATDPSPASADIAGNRSGHSTVVSNGFVYILGGYEDGLGNYMSDAQYAAINNDGTLGDWTLASDNLHLAISYHTSVTYNGYVYVLGGYDGGIRYTEVEYALICTGSNTTGGCNGRSPGDLGTWVVDSGTSFSTARSDHTSVVYNGYVYVIGGWNGGTRYNDVQYALLCTGSNTIGGCNGQAAGAVGTWVTDGGTSFTTARFGHTSVINNGYLYVIGGGTTGFENDVQYALICTGSNNGVGGCGTTAGEIGTWVTDSGTSFSSGRYYHSSAVYNGYLYVMGGDNGSGFSLNDVQYALICTGSNNGVGGCGTTAGEIGTWASTNNMTFGRSSLTSFALNGFIYAIAGHETFGTDQNTTEMAPINSGGDLGFWNYANNTGSYAARYGHASVAYNGYLYVIGGYKGSYLNDVQYAPISSSNGSIGAWSSTNSFTNARKDLGAVVYNGYVYITGGYNGTTHYNDVQYAPINSNGTLGSWITASSTFTSPRREHATVAYNGYLYVIGGYNGSSYYAIQYAAFKADGSLGAFAATTTTFATIRYGLAAVAYNGYMYITGGTGGSFYNDVQYVPIGSDGNITATWTATSSFTTGRYNHTSVVYNGYLYVIGGYDGSTFKNDVQYAPINTNGSLGSFQTTNAFSTARSDHTSVAYGGYLYVVGGSSSLGAGYRSDVQFAAIDEAGATAANATTNAFTTTRADFAAVAYNGYMYVLGGTNGTRLNTVYYAAINSVGTIGSGAWTVTTAFTTAREGMTAVAYNGFMYVLGGKSGNSAWQNTVYYTNIQSSGALGATWTQATSMTTNGSTAAPRWHHSTVAYNGYIYAIGGMSDNSTLVGTTLYAPINSNGSLGTWGSTTAIGVNRAQHASVVYGGYVYVIGGRSTTTDFQKTVYYAAFGSSGTVGSWTSTTAYSSGTEGVGVGATVWNGYLYVTGGLSTGNVVTNKTYYAKLGSTGAISGAWVTTQNLTSVRYGHETVAYNGFIYTLGGMQALNATYVTTVEYAQINNGGPGTTGSWSTNSNSLIGVRSGLASAVYNGYIYTSGGSDGSAVKNEVQYAPISSSGTVGAWHYTHDSTDDSTTFVAGFTSARYEHSMIAYNGYLYINGGRDLSSNYFNDVQYAPLNANGTVGTWSPTASFMNTRRAHGSVAYNGYMYIVGGSNGTTNFDDVQYTPIGSSGTLGAWHYTHSSTDDSTTPTTSLSAVRRNFGITVNNGYIYILGGVSGSTALSDVQYAPLNSNGTIGSWTTTTPLSATRDSFRAFAYNGYMYVLGGNTTTTNEVLYASISSSGALGSWAQTSSFTTGRSLHAVSVYKGYVYLMGGNTGSVVGDVQYAQINSIPRQATYSKLIDLGTGSSVTGFSYNGTLPGGVSSITYRTAGTDGIFGATKTAAATIAECTSTGRYVQIFINLDDTQAGIYPDAVATTNATIADLSSTNVVSEPSGVPPDKRLRHGAFFQNEVLQSFQTNTSGGCG